MLQTEYFDVKEHVVPASHIREYPGTTAVSQEQVLHLHVKQYTPRESYNDSNAVKDKNAITIIAMHGISLPKELYEPLWDELYQQSQSCGYTIRNIWIADMPNHGGSGVLNENELSNDVSWMDMSRDMLAMVNHFRSEMPRPIIGLGHSCGAVQIANVAFMHPRLFTSMIFLDPGFLRTRPQMGVRGEAAGVVNFNTWRKDLWPNRAAAASFIKKTSSDWDPRAIEKMVTYGFRDLPTALYPNLPPGADPADPPVTLTTTKHHSCLTQLRPCFDYRDEHGKIRVNRETHADMDPYLVRMSLYRPEIIPAINHLPTLRPRALFVFGRHTPYSLDDMRDSARMTGTGVGGSGGMAEGNVRETLVDGGHMFPFSAVSETGQVLGSWLSETIARYIDQERRWNDERSSMSKADHQRLPQRWFEVVPNPFKPTKPAGKL